MPALLAYNRLLLLLLFFPFVVVVIVIVVILVHPELRVSGLWIEIASGNRTRNDVTLAEDRIRFAELTVLQVTSFVARSKCILFNLLQVKNNPYPGKHDILKVRRCNYAKKEANKCVI